MQKLQYDILCLISVLLSFSVQEFYGIPWFITFLASISIGWFIGKKLFPGNLSTERKRGLFFIPKNYNIINKETHTLRYILVFLVIAGVLLSVCIFEGHAFYMLTGVALFIGIPVIVYDIFGKEYIELKK